MENHSKSPLGRLGASRPSSSGKGLDITNGGSRGNLMNSSNRLSSVFSVSSATATGALFRDHGNEDSATIFHEDALVARTSPPNSIGIHTS